MDQKFSNIIFDFEFEFWSIVINIWYEPNNSFL